MQDALARDADRFDAVLALPYLFGTTYFAYAACPSKFVLIPCLHDEGFAYLSFVREMLTSSRGLLFNTNAEARFAKTLVPLLPPTGIVGVGIELQRSSPDKRRSTSAPVMLYVGRREAGKNAGFLYECFIRYKERRPGPFTLAFSGAGDPVKRRSDVVEWKPIEGSHDVYSRATIFCNPSVNESLSIVLLQAWLAGLPAVVHGECAVTREHCISSNGGLWFSSYAEFEEVMDRLLASEPLRTTLGRNGQAYVRREYSWDAVLGRFEHAMENILSSAPKNASVVVPTA
jgi:glycosyltransferase involved in cell wall biosynthesis